MDRGLPGPERAAQFKVLWLGQVSVLKGSHASDWCKHDMRGSHGHTAMEGKGGRGVQDLSAGDTRYSRGEGTKTGQRGTSDGGRPRPQVPTRPLGGTGAWHFQQREAETEAGTSGGRGSRTWEGKWEARLGTQQRLRSGRGHVARSGRAAHLGTGELPRGSTGTCPAPADPRPTGLTISGQPTVWNLHGTRHLPHARTWSWN